MNEAQKQSLRAAAHRAFSKCYALTLLADAVSDETDADVVLRLVGEAELALEEVRVFLPGGEKGGRR